MSDSRTDIEALNPYAAPAQKPAGDSLNVLSIYRRFVIGWLVVATLLYCGYQALLVSYSDNEYLLVSLLNVPFFIYWIAKIARGGTGHIFGILTLFLQTANMIGVVSAYGARTKLELIAHAITLIAFVVPTAICWSWAMDAKSKVRSNER